MKDSEKDSKKSKPKISKNVKVMGLVSFFNDIASEMIYPIIPLFLTGVLAAPVAVVGLIEGIAESTASLLKLVSGYLSDKFRKRKPFVTFGYSLSAISKALIGLANAWPFVLIARFVDRLGKGTRTSARDALIRESSTKSTLGRAFGLHRAMDTAGAVLGPLLALAILYFFNLGEGSSGLRTIFFIAVIPSVIGVLLLVFFVRETAKGKEKSAKSLSASSSSIKNKPDKKLTFKGSWKSLDISLKIFIFISVIFAVGNSSDAFLILRAKNLGLTITMAVFAYVLYNITYTIFSMPAGIVSDKIGPKKVLVSGFIIFGFVYLAFGMIDSSNYLWLLFPIYGVYMAFTDGVGKAYISSIAPKEKLGTAFGAYNMATGICAFFASLIAGLLWTNVSVKAPFIVGGVMALAAALLFIVMDAKNKNIITH